LLNSKKGGDDYWIYQLSARSINSRKNIVSNFTAENLIMKRGEKE